MKTKKHDTRWMVSVALMGAIIIVLANTPLGMIQLPIISDNCTYSRHHRSNFTWSVSRSNLRGSVWNLFVDQ